MSAISLPARLPAGTRYVIEGRPGKAGKMRIVSRQLILPNGKLFDLKRERFDEARPPVRRKRASLQAVSASQ
jgi:hypothetical protein